MIRLKHLHWVLLAVGMLTGQTTKTDAQQFGKSMGQPVWGAERTPADENELRYWLTNMVVDHHFSLQEAQAATGLKPQRLEQAADHWDLSIVAAQRLKEGQALKLRPYPGGRHPRIGFLEGAIKPQRETKFSVFLPWDSSSYVVADIPEAIWSNLGLTYLAHTHIDTVWDQQGKKLEALEWHREGEDRLWLERRLPNGLVFGSQVQVEGQQVRMRMWLDNHTEKALTDLRVQNCIMLKAASGFESQEEGNKLIRGSYVACHNAERNRWIITAWEPLHRAWGNPPCPCLHSDPKFPDTAPGESQQLTGVLTFYEGEDIEAALKGLDESGWQQAWEGKSRPMADAHQR